MAATYGEYGMFLPAESAYKTPGAFSEMLRAEASKRATYLSQMDQFYEGLEESKRQFDEMMEYREEQLALQKKQVAAQARLGALQALVGLMQARSQRIAALRSGKHHYLGRGQGDTMSFLREMWQDRMSMFEEMYED